MADERDFELLDDYLTHRMREQDRAAFEQKLQAEPDLQHEYALQKRVIQGIKDARVAELKSMLSNVSIPANGPVNAIASKILLGTVVTLMIAAAAYWYFKRDQIREAQPAAQSEQQVVEAPQPETVSPLPDIKEESQEPVASQKQAVETDKNQTSAGTEHRKPSFARKPDPVAAPAIKNKEKSTETVTPEPEIISGNASSLIVETDADNNRYTFHYQFKDGKLLLYGPMKDNEFEIIEFRNGETPATLLSYKNQYYLLEDAGNRINPLTPVTDEALIKRLEEYLKSK
ncbi:MAG TPA: hypothetical protein VIQ51_00345 [Chryseosolibacter sp.]